MERAGAAVAYEAMLMFPFARRFAVVCGSGSNGGEAGADAGGDLGDRHHLFKGTNGTVGQFDIRHGRPQGKKKARGEPHFSGRTKADSIKVSEPRGKFGKRSFQLRQEFGRRYWNRTNDLHDVNVAL